MLLAQCKSLKICYQPWNANFNIMEIKNEIYVSKEPTHIHWELIKAI